MRRIGRTAHLFPNPQIIENYIRFINPTWLGRICASYIVTVDTADWGFRTDSRGWVMHRSSPSEHILRKNNFIRRRLLPGELVLEIIKALCGGLDEEEANLIYIAVSTDTGCFCYGNTTSDTHRAAAELIDYGANNKLLNKAIFRTFSAARLALEGMIYTGMTTYRDGKVSIAIVTLDMMKRPAPMKTM